MSGRTHRSAPTQCGKRSGDNGKRRGKRTFPQRGGTEPAPYRGSGAGRATAGCAWGVASASQIPKRNLGRQSWSPRPTGATQVVPSEGPMWASAPTKRRESFINHPGQRRTAERLRQRVRGNGWELRQRSSPKGLSTSDNPSVSLRLTAPFAQGSLGDGGCGSPRRPVGPPRNYNGFLSFRGAERRGNPFPFTMDGGSGRRGRRPLRPAGDGGTARRGRRALRVVAGRSHQLPGQRLAKRKARKEQLVKFGLCPMTSERSTAYWVRKSDESPARALVGAASTEQNGLEPHPAARQGASRP